MQHYFWNQPLQNGQTITLNRDIQHHLLQVLRQQIGDQFELVDYKQQLFIAEIVDVDSAKAKIVQMVKRSVEMPVKISLVCGLSKGSKPEWIVQKAVELGAYEIIFVAMDWSIVKWHPNKVNKKLRRLNEVALSAAEQSHRNRVPKVTYLPQLDALFTQNFDAQLVAYEESAKQGEQANLVKIFEKTPIGSSIVAVFGPEGGISPAEIKGFEQQHYILVGLGPRIMRTETAPLYLLAAASYQYELNLTSNNAKI